MRVMFSFFSSRMRTPEREKVSEKKIVDWNWRKLIGSNEMKWLKKKQMKSNEFHRRTNWEKMGSFWHLAQLISAPSYDKGIDWKRATVVDINCFIEKWFCKDVTLGTDIERTNGRTDKKINDKKLNTKYTGHAKTIWQLVKIKLLKLTLIHSGCVWCLATNVRRMLFLTLVHNCITIKI